MIEVDDLFDVAQPLVCEFKYCHIHEFVQGFLDALARLGRATVPRSFVRDLIAIKFYSESANPIINSGSAIHRLYFQGYYKLRGWEYIPGSAWVKGVKNQDACFKRIRSRKKLRTLNVEEKICPRCQGPKSVNVKLCRKCRLQVLRGETHD